MLYLLKSLSLKYFTYFPTTFQSVERFFKHLQHFTHYNSQNILCKYDFILCSWKIQKIFKKPKIVQFAFREDVSRNTQFKEECSYLYPVPSVKCYSYVTVAIVIFKRASLIVRNNAVFPTSLNSDNYKVWYRSFYLIFLSCSTHRRSIRRTYIHNIHSKCFLIVILLFIIPK